MMWFERRRTCGCSYSVNKPVLFTVIDLSCAVSVVLNEAFKILNYCFTFLRFNKNSLVADFFVHREARLKSSSVKCPHYYV